MSSVRQSMRSCARRQTIKNVTQSTTRCNVFSYPVDLPKCVFCSFVLTFFSSFQQCHDEYAEECKTEYSQECWDEPRQACHTESTQVTELGKYLCSCLLCIFTRSVQQSILKSAELNMNRFNRTWSGRFFLKFSVSGLPH